MRAGYPLCKTVEKNEADPCPQFFYITCDIPFLFLFLSFANSQSNQAILARQSTLIVHVYIYENVDICAVLSYSRRTLIISINRAN